MRERKIEWHPKTRQLCQIPKEGLEYALVSEDYRQIHQLVWCKDFIQDAIYGHINKKKVTIYGFEYDPATYPPVYLEQTRLMIANWKDANFERKLLENCQEFLHQIESVLSLRKTVIERCKNPPPRYRKAGVFLLNGSKRWMNAPPMVSLYTLLIRVGFVHPVGQSAMTTLEQIKAGKLQPYNHHPSKDTDADLVRRVFAGIERILRYGDRRLFHRDIRLNYPLQKLSGGSFSIHTMHDNCGMAGFTSAYNKEDFPHWYRLLGG
jgi:hypothetical protein